MDNRKTLVRPNPRKKANILSVIFWVWTIKFFKVSYVKSLKPESLFDPLSADQSEILGDRLEREWSRELARSKKRKKQPSLWLTILRCFWWELTWLGLIQIANEVLLRLGIPILIGQLLHYVNSEEDGSYNIALMYAGGICLANMVHAVVQNHEWFGGFYVGGKVRIAICSLIYRKTLRLSATALVETAPGKIVNLIANDVNRFDMSFLYLHYMWSAPLVAVIIGYFLYAQGGWAGLIGFAVIFIVVPAQTYTGKLTALFRSQSILKTDERVQLMEEIISGVQVIKMYVWEKAFCSMIAFIRKLELKMIRYNYWLRAVFMTCFLFTPRMALYFTLIIMMLLGQPLAAEKVFVFFSYLSLLAEAVGATFVRGISEIAETLVAIRRFQEFMLYDEYEVEGNRKIFIENGIGDTSNLNCSTLDNSHKAIEQKNGEISESQISPYNNSILIEVKNLTATWKREEESPTNNLINDVTLDIEAGKMYILIGTVGSGKSSLISAILGEIPISKGQVNVRGSISYASQEGWIFGSTIRQNILFGQPYDRQRYQDVIKVCALVSDFEQFPQGDQTIIGERGSSVSGGQKARINMARAVYRNADIYILDDPLSAVDTHVGNHLFEECLQKYLGGKTKIVATHQLQYVKEADMILVIDQGKLQQYQTYEDFLNNRPEYSKLLSSQTSDEEADDSANEEENDNRKKSATSGKRPSVTFGDNDKVEAKEDDSQLDDNLETSTKGVIKGSIFIKYIRSGGNWFCIFIVGIFCILAQSVTTLNDLYFPIIVTAEEKRYNEFLEKKSIEISNVSREFSDDVPYDYIYIYTGIVASILVLSITQSMIFYALCMNASQNLHDTAFGALVKTGMKFFDTNPEGRILNRFSKDMDAIDEILPKTLHDAELILLITIGGFVIICIINPIFLIPLLILSFINYWLVKVYIKTGKNIKRVEGILKSPVFTHLTTTLNGLITIRAYGAQSILKCEFDRFQDNHSSAWYMFIVTSCAFGFFLDSFCSVFTAIVAFTLLLVGGYSKAEVGLAVTTIISMSGLVQWGMRQSAEVLNQMTSVERVLEYTQLPPEDNLSKDDGGLSANRKMNKIRKASINLLSCVPKDWPSAGLIRFKNVYMRYNENEEPVLKGLDLVIKAGEKVGIVGRSGAGKSSLISALFRLRNVDGVIEIDGVDTARIALQDLRKRISIIPQNPVLFTGTLRKNLDPFNECTDEAVWATLEEVELKDSIINEGNTLESQVLHRGANFSTGQKQLICLARAILRKNRILILDEATANVDPHTDELIQQTIRTKFGSCTVLTVAHRLNTIMDSDRVIVMDKGQIMEFDHPYTLLLNESGYFSSLVRETGRAISEQLYNTAKQVYDRIHTTESIIHPPRLSQTD